jgi:hypothetical protein
MTGRSYGGPRVEELKGLRASCVPAAWIEEWTSHDLRLESHLRYILAHHASVCPGAARSQGLRQGRPSTTFR